MVELADIAGLDMEVVLGSRYARVVSLADPAVGHDWSVTVPGGRRWRVRSILATLTTSAVVVNRYVEFRVSDGTTIFARLPRVGSQGASMVHTLCALPGAQATALQFSGDAVLTAWTDVMCETGYVISSLTTGIDVGDQWSGIVLYVEEHTTGPPPPRRVVEAIGQS